jgi:ferredoxin
MSTTDEIDYNTCIFSQQEVPDELRERVSRLPRRLLIEDWCLGCGACVSGCKAGALYLDDKSQQVRVDSDKCTLCSYCGALCPEFCIKVI